MVSTAEISISPLPAFSDNYLWLLARDGHAAIVDPGDPAPVQRALDARGLKLDAILVTHHHGDHVGGVTALRATGAVKLNCIGANGRHPESAFTRGHPKLAVNAGRTVNSSTWSWPVGTPDSDSMPRPHTSRS